VTLPTLRDVQRYVLFDLDGTLVNSNASVARTWKRLADAAGFDESRLHSLHGIPAKAFIRTLLGEARVDEVAYWTQWHLDNECEDVGDVVAYPAANHLLQWLTDQADFDWGIVTSCQRPLALARMNAAGLVVPEVFITADDVQHGKPHPEPYLLGMQRIGARADQSFVVEDAPNGIRSGIDAGAIVLAVTTSHPAAEVGHAHAVVETLEGVLDYLIDDVSLRTNNA